MKYNSIGEQLIAKAQELDPNYKPDKFNDMSEALDVILNNTGGSSEGGDIWLDITPYLSEDESIMSISEEGYNLVYNAFFPEIEKPSNKYAGILFMGYKMFFNEFFAISDKIGLNFIYNMAENGIRSYMKISIYNDKSIEMIEEPASSSNKIWYSLSQYSGKITQKEYDELLELLGYGKLAGIIIDLLEMGKIFIPLLCVKGDNTICFGVTDVSVTNYSNYDQKSISKITCDVKSDLSVSLDLPSYDFVAVTYGLKQQVIPSIVDDHQENLTIGDGLKIENGVLKTKDLEMAISITATLDDLKNAVNSFSNIIYNESDKAEINSFIKNQKGIIKLTITTPVGNLCMTLRPTLWKDDDANSYNFEGSLYIETNLSTIGGSTFNQIIVRAVAWDGGAVAFRPTIIPIGK